MDKGLRAAIKAAGTKYRLAKTLRITPQSIQRWRQIPAKRVREIERQFNVDRKILRPDLYA